MFDFEGLHTFEDDVFLVSFGGCFRIEAVIDLGIDERDFGDGYGMVPDLDARTRSLLRQNCLL